MTEQTTRDITKLKRIRGGHKAAFTRLTTKVDEFVSASIRDDERLCEAEALLSSLKGKLLDFHRWDTEIQLEIEDEGDLNADIGATTEFEISANTTIARLTALIDNYKKQIATLTTTRRSSSPYSHT